MTARAIPVHTIVRYRPSPLSFYAGWAPIEVLRFRLFVDASHQAVTGDDYDGAPWDRDWSCETLSGGEWLIEGRNEWPTLEAAIAATSINTFATFEEARAVARDIAARAHKRARDRAAEAKWNLDEISKAKPPVLP